MEQFIKNNCGQNVLLNGIDSYVSERGATGDVGRYRRAERKTGRGRDERIKKGGERWREKTRRETGKEEKAEMGETGERQRG